MPIRPLLGRQAFQPTSLASAMLQRGQMAEEQARQQTAPWAAVAQKTGADAAAAVQAHQQEAQARPGKLLALASQLNTMQGQQTAARQKSEELERDYSTDTIAATDRLYRRVYQSSGDEEQKAALFQEGANALHARGLGFLSKYSETPRANMTWPGMEQVESYVAGLVDAKDLVKKTVDPASGLTNWELVRMSEGYRTQEDAWKLDGFRVSNAGSRSGPQNLWYNETTQQFEFSDRTSLPPGAVVSQLETGVLSLPTALYDQGIGADVMVRFFNKPGMTPQYVDGTNVPKHVLARLQPGLSSDETAKIRGANQMMAMLDYLELQAFAGENPIFTGEGIGHKFSNALRLGKMYLGYDAQMQIVLRLRTALAAQAAVTQQGARPSDYDTKGTWLPMVPHPVWNTKPEAEMMFGVLRAWVSSAKRPSVTRETGDLTRAPEQVDSEFRAFVESQEAKFANGVKAGDLMIMPKMDPGGQEILTESGYLAPQWYRAESDGDNADAVTWTPFNTQGQIVQRIAKSQGLTVDKAKKGYTAFLDGEAKEVTKDLNDQASLVSQTLALSNRMRISETLN
jgi:hypothetical protein